ncbi:MAG TPA: DUF2269 family protein [Gemmatimonadales bacterium]
MNHFWLFVHLLGFTMWLGGGMAAMFVGIASRSEDRTSLGAVVRGLAVIHKRVVSPGAALTVLSGLVLTFKLAGMAAPSPWLMAMQGAGLLGAVLNLAVMLPTASRAARIDPTGPNGAYFDELRNRMRVMGMIVGTLGLIALVAGAMIR